MCSLKHGLLIMFLGMAMNWACDPIVSRALGQSSNSVADESAQRFQEMRIAAQAIEAIDESETRVAMVLKPMFRFNDAARGYPDGTIWAWGTKGRPVATGDEPHRRHRP